MIHGVNRKTRAVVVSSRNRHHLDCSCIPLTFVTMMTSKSFVLILVALGPFLCSAFTGVNLPRSIVSKTSLSVGPLQKITNKKEYNTVVENLMQTKGLTREQAEKEYNAYLDNPNDYALQKVRHHILFPQCCSKKLMYVLSLRHSCRRVKPTTRVWGISH